MPHCRQTCTKSYCNNCTTGNAADIWSCCSPETPCEEFKGDCDSHADCKGNLICGHDNCGDMFEPFTDCCVRVPLGIILADSSFVSHFWSNFSSHLFPKLMSFQIMILIMSASYLFEPFTDCCVIVPLGIKTSN